MASEHRNSQRRTEPGLQQAPLVEAGRELAQRKMYGLVWLDEELDIVARFGSLVNFAEIGLPITECCPALSGYEDDIHALRSEPANTLNLPAIVIVNAQGETPRINLTVMWAPASNRYLFLASRAITDTGPQLELSRQMRARLIAEEQVIAKSRELAQANAQLELANRDLEDYAAIISHDLQAPLRALRYLADDIETQIDGQQTPALQKKLEALRAQSRRMTGMLSALLDYASVGHKSDTVTDVNTADLVKSVVSSISRPADFHVQIRGEWPTLRTAAAPLDLVLRNLVDNAIKHHDRDGGLITIEASMNPTASPAADAPNRDKSTAFIEFVVADDGPGIDPRHHESALLPFRTLSTTQEPKGHGMGLAFIRRTVETIGGRLELRSNPAEQRGCAVHIMWPLEIVAQPGTSVETAHES